MTSMKPDIWIEKKALEYKFASGINTTTVEQENKTDLVPLYTHPVKELTDDDIEIFKAAASYYGIECQSSTGLGEFIKQIVRKAQEK